MILLDTSKNHRKTSRINQTSARILQKSEAFSLKNQRIIMVVLNDVGLTFEIIGFALFLFVPIQESYGLLLNGGKISKSRKIHDFINEHDKFRIGLRYGGISLIILGLVMQYSFLNQTI